MIIANINVCVFNSEASKRKTNHPNGNEKKTKKIRGYRISDVRSFVIGWLVDWMVNRFFTAVLVNSDKRKKPQRKLINSCQHGKKIQMRKKQKQI